MTPQPYIIKEDELARRCGMTSQEWASAVIILERTNFPKKHPVLGFRIRKAVEQWFDNDSTPETKQTIRPHAPDGAEKWQNNRTVRV